MIIEEYRAIFIHIPKNAGSSIKEFFDKELTSIRKHDTACQIKDRFPEQYSSYRKFAIIRNPYERMVSWYSYLKRDAFENVISFKEWLKDPYKFWHFDKKETFIKFDGPAPVLRSRSLTNKVLDPQVNWIDETVIVLRYENLKEDLNTFFKEEIDLPWVNKSSHDHYLKYYDQESLDIVYDRYKEDFEKFNFKKEKITNNN